MQQGITFATRTIPFLGRPITMEELDTVKRECSHLYYFLSILFYGSFITTNLAVEHCLMDSKTNLVPTHSSQCPPPQRQFPYRRLLRNHTRNRRRSLQQHTILRNFLGTPDQLRPPMHPETLPRDYRSHRRRSHGLQHRFRQVRSFFRNA